MTTEQLKRDLLVKAVHAFDDKYPMTAVQRMDLGPLIGDAVDKIIEQLSAQTAEPCGYVLKTGHGTAFRESLAGVEPDFVKHWVPLYTHPAKTEQPSLSDRELFEAHIRMISPKRLFIERWSDGSYRHIEIEEMWKGWQAAISAQRQDSNKEHN